MDKVGWDDREKALQLHRSGQLGVALVAYEALLADAPGDPDLLGLMGVLALQDQRTGDAEALLGRSLAAGGTAPIHLRNLNNYLVLLKETGREDDARALVGGELPEWPENVVPTAAERGTVLSLTEALLLLDQPGKARRLLDRALPERSGDAEVLGLTGRVRLALGAARDAIDLFERAAALRPEDPKLLIALAAAHHSLGDQDAEHQAVRRFACAAPLTVAPALGSHAATILVLNATPLSIVSPNATVELLHHAMNYGGQVSQAMKTEYRFMSALGDLPSGDLPDDIPHTDIILNNMANSELMNVPGRLDAAVRLVERIGAPVINHPHAVFQTTRQKANLLLQGIPGLRLPAIERYNTDIATVAEIAADISGRFAYPVILRKPSAHMSSKSVLSDQEKSAVLLDDAAAVREYLERYRWREFYAVEYIDLRKPEGYFRKIRAVIVGDQVIITNGGYFGEWMVAGWWYTEEGIAFYRAHPECTLSLRRIVNDPEATLGAGCLRILEAIRDRMPLDFFGIDFDIDDEGQVVMFEASASMVFLPYVEAPEDTDLPAEPYIRVNDAFRALVTRRLAEASLPA